MKPGPLKEVPEDNINDVWQGGKWGACCTDGSGMPDMIVKIFGGRPKIKTNKYTPKCGECLGGSVEVPGEECITERPGGAVCLTQDRGLGLAKLAKFANFANFWRARSRLYQNEICKKICV